MVTTTYHHGLRTAFAEARPGSSLGQRGYPVKPRRKGWGAVAQMLKACSPKSQRGWEHERHRHFSPTSPAGCGTSWATAISHQHRVPGSAEGLAHHENFYEARTLDGRVDVALDLGDR